MTDLLDEAERKALNKTPKTYSRGLTWLAWGLAALIAVATSHLQPDNPVLMVTGTVGVFLFSLGVLYVVVGLAIDVFTPWGVT